MYVKMDISKNDLDDLLWSGARQRWLDATDDQREEVWDRIESLEDPTMTDVNDLVWFDCDDIFFHEEEEVEESCVNEAEGFLADGEYTVWHKPYPTADWVQDFTFDSLEKAEKEAERESRNNRLAKVVDREGKIVARYKDMFPIKR